MKLNIVLQTDGLFMLQDLEHGLTLDYDLDKEDLEHYARMFPNQISVFVAYIL